MEDVDGTQYITKTVEKNDSQKSSSPDTFSECSDKIIEELNDQTDMRIDSFHDRQD